jgi:L-aminopeptidase/D-esterase-like protein
MSTATRRDSEWPDGPVPPKELDVIFIAVIEAVEEAILNSILTAVTTTGDGGHVSRAVPLEHVRAGSGNGFM